MGHPKPKSTPLDLAELYPRATPRGLEVHPVTVKALRVMASQDVTRVNLCGIGLDIPSDRSKSWLCATDGKRLIRIPVIGEIPAGVYSPLWNLGELEQAELRAKLCDVVARSSSGATLLVLPWIDGNMPSSSHVVPQDCNRARKRESMTLNFDPRFLADIARSADILGKACRQNVFVTVGALADGCATTRFDLVCYSGAVLAQVAIMPMKDMDNGRKFSLPASHAPQVEIEPAAPEVTKTDIPEIKAAKAVKAKRERKLRAAA